MTTIEPITTLSSIEESQEHLLGILADQKNRISARNVYESDGTPGKMRKNLSLEDALGYERIKYNNTYCRVIILDIDEDRTLHSKLLETGEVPDLTLDGLISPACIIFTKSGGCHALLFTDITSRKNEKQYEFFQDVQFNLNRRVGADTGNVSGAGANPFLDGVDVVWFENSGVYSLGALAAGLRSTGTWKQRRRLRLGGKRKDAGSTFSSRNQTCFTLATQIVSGFTTSQLANLTIEDVLEVVLSVNTSDNYEDCIQTAPLGGQECKSIASSIRSYWYGKLGSTDYRAAQQASEGHRATIWAEMGRRGGKQGTVAQKRSQRAQAAKNQEARKAKAKKQYAEYLELSKSGVSNAHAAERIGVSIRTIQRWVKNPPCDWIVPEVSAPEWMSDVTASEAMITSCEVNAVVEARSKEEDIERLLERDFRRLSKSQKMDVWQHYMTVLQTTPQNVPFDNFCGMKYKETPFTPWIRNEEGILQLFKGGHYMVDYVGSKSYQDSVQSRYEHYLAMMPEGMVKHPAIEAIERGQFKGNLKCLPSITGRTNKHAVGYLTVAEYEELSGGTPFTKSTGGMSDFLACLQVEDDDWNIAA